MVSRSCDCGGFKLEKGKIKIGRQLVSRTLDEISPFDVWGLQECMRCGICRYTCPFWLTTEKSTDVPAWRTYEVNKLFSMYYTGYGIVARYLRLRKLKDSEFKQWFDSAYNCTACGGCTETSPLEIPNWYTAILLRRILHFTGFNLGVPEKWISNVKETGNAMGIIKEKWVEIANSVGLQIDKKGAELLYVPSSLEVNSNILGQISKILDGMNSNFTVSSDISDSGYYAYLAGDFETARKRFMNIYEEAKKLNVKKIIVSDGSSYFFLRWQGPKSLRYKLDIQIEHLTETIYNAYNDRRVKLEKADIKDDATVHDSEFLSRLGGLHKPPRELMKIVLPSFKEPKPDPSSHVLFTCGHHLEMIPEKKEIVKKARLYAAKQLSNWAKTVVTFDPNCQLSMENAVKDSQGIEKSIYFTEVLANSVRS
ncbi:(Fe-S)-binding protein [Acidianus sp. RZ1]|uniref:(Fe-S)-binding protein n=1 Tax=Acidianus sp. RZ1 TaxID=1540082 RepID=UPI0014922EDC|nr:(Fe-S)-binding protein [Acidianus sp. RZ1]NON62500.1 (Fe-S)-binding protein [Acidianus sp. RZ1]